MPWNGNGVGKNVESRKFNKTKTQQILLPIFSSAKNEVFKAFSKETHIGNESQLSIFADKPPLFNIVKTIVLFVLLVSVNICILVSFTFAFLVNCRKWISEAFVGILSGDTLLYVWDVIFMYNWSKVNVIIVMIMNSYHHDDDSNLYKIPTYHPRCW